MEKHELREDKECQNCGYTVEMNYCTQCGQKNTETRQSFLHLVKHFAEDLTHYDSGFWQTIKYLLFNPGRLTIAYLQGNRQKYVPPVKLYIFISFITFLLIAVMPDSAIDSENTKPEESGANVAENDSVEINNATYTSIKQIDSLRHSGHISMPLYYISKAVLTIKEKNISTEEFVEAMIHSFPKILFLYMPVFSFWLWLFHGKKRWYFFDHGIFTLHYFSFMLLLFSFLYVISWLLEMVFTDFTITDVIAALSGFIFSIYPFFYFFRAHNKMYGEKRWISRLKSLIIFIMNIMSFSVVMLLALLYIAMSF